MIECQKGACGENEGGEESWKIRTLCCAERVEGIEY